MPVQKYTDAKAKANKKWGDQNKEHRAYLNARSTARSFIRNRATVDDLDELVQLIANRRVQLKE